MPSSPFISSSNRRKRSQIFTKKKPEIRKMNMEAMFAEIELCKNLKSKVKRLAEYVEEEDQKKHRGKRSTKKKQHTCTVCNMQFRKPAYLEQHLLVHSEERAFKCTFEECNRDFRRKDHLERHVLTHKGISFSCPSCEDTFKYKANMKRHLKEHESRDKPDQYVQCEFTGCQLKFLNNSNMKKHMQIKHPRVSSVQSSQQVAIKQQKLENEVDCLKCELHQVREHQLALVRVLCPEMACCNDLSGKIFDEVAALMATFTVLEDKQRQQIQALELALAAEKLKAMVEHEEQKKMIKDLQSRIADGENLRSQAMVEHEEQKKMIKDLQSRIADGENLRKQLNNTILELKGNIRVFCRVRPAIPDSDGNDTEGPIVSYPTSTEALGRGIDLMHHGQKYSFTFDKVFTHDSSQEDVFVEVSELVQSALDGYKVCIFAYGQTGSGKTYTMMGTHEQKGLIPRSLEQIFETIQSLQTQGWKYKIKVSILEIYNEYIRDLFSPIRHGSPVTTPSKKYDIKHDSDGNSFVTDLKIIEVCSIKEVGSLLQQAAQNRSVGKTQMNEQSSRSHSVFTLRISGVNESTEQKVHGILNLIDLAGSERLARSGAIGDRLKETQAINKSLSSLSDVIFAIAKKEDHVPYRNSKLTYLLQPCLSGDSKTLMFINVSPEASSAGESLSSLRFAARVNSCEIGIPRRHTQMRSVDETRTPHSKPPKNKALCHSPFPAIRSQATRLH